ncbi:MAG: response regulator [bacterium]|nr:response regulator [bacterium]
MSKMTKILIVDDDRHFIQQVRTLLSTFDWASGFVTRAEHVFPKLERDAFDLILLDLNMPDTSGVSLLKQLRAHPLYHSLPVIMLTVAAEDNVLAECFEHGATDFITKPVKELVVKARLQSALTTQTYIQQIQHQKEALEEQTVELHHSNTHLQQGMIERRQVEEELKQHCEHLEELVEERTTEIIQINGQLQQEIIVKMQAQEALRKSEERLRSGVQNMPVMMNAFDAHWNLIVWNRECERVTGYNADEIVGNPKAMELLYPDAASRERMITKWNERGNDYRDWEWDIVCKDRSVKTVSWSNISERFPIPGWAIWGIGMDITGRKRAAEQIKAALREKEVLLKEIHHRVKNNLQVVASLLSLQAKRLPDDETRVLFNDSRNRVKSMALVHETLYQSGDLSRLNFAVYLRTLIAHIFSSYRGRPGRITSKVTVGNVSLSIEAAAPCGLIVNELVSNALKYAFPERTGEIRVEMDVNDHDQYVLVVSDNGVGFPEDVDFRDSGSLGLKLVHLLIDQLNGTIDLQNDDGTTFTLVFTEPKYMKRV